MYTLYQEEKKIPTPIAFSFILLIVFILGLTLNKPTTSSVSASKLKLERLEVTNVTYNSASIYWRTKEKEINWLIFGKDKNILDKQALDDRDIANNKNPSSNHYTTLRDLQMNQNYFFEIVTTSGLIKQSNGLPFSFTTKTQLPLPPSLSPAMGNVKDKNGNPLKNGVVLLKIENTELLSDMTKDKGEWLIPLYYLIRVNTNEFIQSKIDTPVMIQIISEKGETSIINTYLNKISPLPQTIIIGKNYDFTKKEEKVLSETTIQNQSSFRKIDTISPKENAAIPGKRPIFRGIALPNKKIKIVVESKSSQTYEIYADKDGLWKLIPYYDLDPGKHQITTTTEDENGKEVKIVRTFNILKSGESVLGEATPSATITPINIPTNIPAPSPTTFITPTPAPTITVIVTRSAPAPGVNFTPTTMISTALIILGAGLIMVF